MTCFTLVVFAATACASRAARQTFATPGAPPPLDTAAILATARREIDDANAAWLPALRRHDAASIVAAYADSGLFVGPDGSVVRGREAVARMYEARFTRMSAVRDGGILQGGLTAVTPDVIYEWGEGWVELAPTSPGGQAIRSKGRYLTVWQRSPDGHWRIVRNLSL